MKQVNVYFIACAKTIEVKAFDGNVLTPAGKTVWLADDEGYPQCSYAKEDALHFKSEENIRCQAAEWDGMPWYFRLAPCSLRIFKVTETTIHEVVEKECT